MFKVILSLSFTLLSVCFGFSSFAQKDYSKLVNPFIGTGGHGHTYPGATSPFGFVQLSPDTRMADWDGSSGYHYSDSIIYGFSHTHLSGTGVPDYCDILFQPTIGNYEWDNKKYASHFKHASERAHAGFYGVHLDKYNINVRLTTTTRTGLHRYHFPENTVLGNVIVDLIHRDIVLDSYLEVVDKYTIKGYRFSKSWANNQKLFFVARFNKAIIKNEIHVGSGTKLLSEKMAKGNAIQAGFSFDVTDGKPVMVQVALSPVSMDGAMLNLNAEQPVFDDKKDSELHFENTLQQNVLSWNKELSKIEIESHPYNNIDTIFYTALYHTMIVPNIYQDVDGQYRGTDDKIHKAEGYTNYTVFSLWDTYRAYHPLMSIINKERTRDWIHTFLNQYKHGGMLPVWELSGNETFCMIGYHSVPVIVDAYKKGIKDFDTNLALEAMLNYSKSNRFGIDKYAHKGFLSNVEEHESVSKTMEYAYDDWCIAEFAKMLGKAEIAEEYYKRSLNYRNLYNPATGFFQGKLHASWYTPFDPNEINNFYTEGNAWQYSLAAPHDVDGMKKLMGGEDPFTNHLQKLFTTTSKTTGRDQADVTGLIGQYAQGNEPSHHISYMFNHTNKPALTAFYVNKICTEFYKNAPDGLIGNEDCGQMSAWYIWSALGMYPMNAANNEFEIGSPQIKKAILHLENGREIVINSKKINENDIQPAKIIVDGRELKSKTVKYEDFKNGSKINFIVDDKSPFVDFTIAKEESLKKAFIPVPFIAKGNVKFKNQTSVALESVSRKEKIYYFIKDNTSASESNYPYRLYTNPFLINNNCELLFYSEFNKNKSATIYQPFYKIPIDITITIVSKLNPMYTAGGSDALIDGIKGTENWRAGEWQSYYGNDFEAIVDFKKVRNVQQVKCYFLQDTRSWIWMPTEMEISSSNNGKDFVSVGTTKNRIDEKDETVQVANLQVDFSSLKTRYIKIKAKNYGIIPTWHLGAGNTSHLFISEVEVK
jgi:predicted alpha-1,2-mannosidase